MYEDAIQSNIEAIRHQKLAINGLKLDALEIGGSALYEKMLRCWRWRRIDPQPTDLN